MKRSVFVLAVLFVVACVAAVRAEKAPPAKDKITPPTAAWVAKVRELAPAAPTVPAAKHKVLVFSLLTGYDHLVIPHVNRVFEVLGEKSGAFDATVSADIESLMSANLAAYDVLVLNNNCSKSPRRNLFLDEMERNPVYQKLSAAEREAKAQTLEQAMLDFVAGGKGLVVIHGGPTLLNSSAKFTEMVGGAFDYHPKNQEVTLTTVDPSHPLVAAFRDKGPFVHLDEPYCFDGPYDKLNFRPLLVMDTKTLQDDKGHVADCVRYVAWIKPHGAGRVFFCSPSHFPESYETATLLQFLLDGVQYAAGDLKCPDAKP